MAAVHLSTFAEGTYVALARALPRGREALSDASAVVVFTVGFGFPLAFLASLGMKAEGIEREQDLLAHRPRWVARAASGVFLWAAAMALAGARDRPRATQGAAVSEAEALSHARDRVRTVSGFAMFLLGSSLVYFAFPAGAKAREEGAA